ncbi:hypothetical protein GCM10010524_51970 [Streptomyces mexicanus]|uniref:DUF397 domain-containing protein n=1 Tax=Streptomyces mexicanus TaxID=178566 RepID=A0A7X1I2K6_9ACTN|nr:DUF397 domain-containing protein [Streptomyces mexicanus]
MAGREPSGRVWVRSSYSGEAGNCVEVAFGSGGDRALVRDSKRPSGAERDAVLAFRRQAWCGFLAGLGDPGAGCS